MNYETYSTIREKYANYIFSHVSHKILRFFPKSNPLIGDLI